MHEGFKNVRTLELIKGGKTLNTITKLGIGAGLIGLLYLGAKAAKNAIANFSFNITGYRTPKLSGTKLTIPLEVTFTNPTPLPINIDKLVADIYMDKNGSWVKAAQIAQPVAIAPGTSMQVISPVVDLKSILSGNLIDNINALDTLVNTRKVKVRGDVTAVYQGVTLPSQSFTNEIEV